MKKDLDLETLEYVKLTFTLYSDSSCDNMGYRRLCELIEETKEINMITIGEDKFETKTNEGFLNETNLKFNDISSELERNYRFPNGTTYHIKEPLYLNVSKSGGHRLYSADGLCHYVQPKEGWAISWKVREGKPSFVK